MKIFFVRILFRNFLFLILIIFCSNDSGIAQNVNTDSLFKLWSDTSLSDKARVLAFYNRFDPLVDESQNPEALKWVPHLMKAIQLAEVTNQKDLLPRFFALETGVYILIQFDEEKGCTAGKKAIKAGLETGDLESVGISLSLIKFCLNPEEREEIYKSIPLDEINLDYIALYIELMDYYFRLSDLPTVIDLSQRIINKWNQLSIQDNFPMSSVYKLLGESHNLLGNFEESKKYDLMALHFAKKSNLASAIGTAFMELLNLSLVVGELEKAKSYRDSAYFFMENMRECEKCMSLLIMYDAKIDNVEGRHPEALNKLQKIRKNFINDTYYNYYSTGGYYYELAKTYFHLKRYEKALVNANAGIGISPKSSLSLLNNYEIIYKIYVAIGNHKAALEYYQKYVDTKEQIIERRNSRLVTKKELEFQFRQKQLSDSLFLERKKVEQELSFQKELNNQKTTKYYLLATSILAIIMTIGFYFRYRFIQKTKTQLEKKNYEIELEKSKAQQSEKAKHQFLANMSHEIRTPMNAIKGMTDILIRRNPKNSQLSYLNGIKQSSESLLVVINDILDISKIEAGKIELEEITFSIQDVIKNVLTIMSFKAEEKGIELHSRIELEKYQVTGDPTRLHQILLNLIGNAIKFTEKGSVSILAKTKSVEENVINILFTISDTGIGIDTNRIEKIFHSFEQAYSDTSRKFGGTGLGLSISKKLVELQGGRIWVESKKGIGSEFYFEIAYKLPEYEVSSEKLPDSSFEKMSNSLKDLRILLVEDNVFNSIVAKEELEDHIEDVFVDVAENGAIAVEKMKLDYYDIILMDVQMPKMNGYEATEMIRSFDNEMASIPIIAMTANVMKEEIERCYEAGMDDFIGKPFQIHDLIGKLYQLTQQKNHK